jgi:DNA polymerase-1
MKKRLAIIDGKSVFYRGYYAMPNLSTADGTPTGGVFGFVSLAIELIKKLEPDYVAVAWDKKSTNIRRRREIYPEYKAGRKPAPADFYEQIPILYELLEAFGWPLYELDDYEADDIMGAFAKQAREKGVEALLLTSDLDALQLVDDNTKVYALKNGLSNIEEFDVAHFEQKYGIEVEQFLDLKSLKGDASDNLPGVPGVGEKTAITLLQEYQTLDGVYEHIDDIKPTIAKKLIAGKELAYISKEVGRIWVDAPVDLEWEIADVNDTDLAKVATILKRLEFHSLARRLPAHMQDTPDTSLYIEEKHKSDVVLANWPNELSINGPVVVAYKDDELLFSPSNNVMYKKRIQDIDNSVWAALRFATVVAYDIKQILHILAGNGIVTEFGTVHDIRQAAFLIDPLKRDRSLSGLIGEDEELSAEQEISALWQIYQWQKEALSNNESLKKIAELFDFPLTQMLFKMERSGIKIDTDFLAKMSDELAEEYTLLEQEMYAMVGYEFNIASPMQLSEALFVKIGLPTAGIKKGRKGYSTGQKELDKLRGKHPIIELIEKTREVAKMKNTYVDALPKLVDEQSRLHTTFNQDVASTGRLSSTNPNLQNIPIRSELGHRIRHAFIPEKGNVFISADYSQFELRLAAVLADDKALIEDFNNDIDIHTKTASEVYGVPLDAVTKDQRRDAKVINFGVLYGMSSHGLAAATGMSIADAKSFIEQYFALRQPISKFIDDTLKKARTEGYVETFYGRRRPTPDIHSSNFVVRMSAERAAANMPIQGTEADLMKRAMLLVDEKIAGLGTQILQIHDSILIEAPEDNAGKIENILRDTMESIAPELPIKLKVDITTGKSWGELG